MTTEMCKINNSIVDSHRGVGWGGGSGEAAPGGWVQG
jgi:hypothetical protein